jgi:hypothetical protein
MAVFRAQISFQLDTAFPRDAVTITPHYQGDNAQALADALKTNLMAHSLVGAAGLPFKVRVYDAEKPPPSYPLASSANGTGFVPSSHPREIALCLSYYSTWNRPSYRGRLYIPGHLIGSQMALRPTASQITAGLAWANTLGKGLPAQHTWSVWSKKLQRAFTISDVWVDDEWDTVRSRGLRGETRQVATLP